jgi:alpha-beta hydrolase superfamily lysophospholipase
MTDRFVTTDGVSLRAREAKPSGTPAARVVMIHGIGDQVEGLPYVMAARALAARGFLVHRMELRGHGLSGGPRVYVRDWSEYRTDLAQFIESVDADTAALPLFLVGVSMGGLIVTNFGLHHPAGVRGVAAVEPALGDTGGSPLLRALLPVLARVIPKVGLDPKLDLSRLTRDPVLLQTYVTDDELYQRRVTPRLAAQLLATIAETRRRAAEFTVPLLVQHGTADTVTSPTGSREFCERAGSADKTYRAYEGAYHNLFVETNRDEVYDDLAAWMAARV